MTLINFNIKKRSLYIQIRWQIWPFASFSLLKYIAVCKGTLIGFNRRSKNSVWLVVTAFSSRAKILEDFISPPALFFFLF